MKTPFSASSMPAYDYIQLDTYLVDFTTSDTDARSSNSISTQIDFDPAAIVSGFANFQYGGSAPDSDISVSSSSLAATARDSDSGSLVFQIAPDNAQNDGTITDHFTGGGDFVFSSDVVTVINADTLITATGTDAGLVGDDNFAIVLDSTVNSFEPTATEDSSVVGYEANYGFTVAPPSDFTDTKGNLESGLFYLDSDNGGSGSILSNNSFIGSGGPSSVFGSSDGISTGSTLGAQSGPLTSELLPNSSLTYAANAPFDVQLPAAPSNLSNEGNVSSNLPSIMTFRGSLENHPQASCRRVRSRPVTPSSGLVINITYDSSVANAPAGFEAVVASVVQFYESEFTNPITLNIDVGWGEINGQSLGPGALGESESYLESFSYSQIQTALIANATSSNQLSAVSSLPTSAPVNGTFYLTLADATALGLLSSSTILDGYVGFNSSFSYAYNDSSGVPAGAYDLYGVVAHEISEVMGRISMLDSSNSYSDLDLFRYSAPGVLSFVGTTSAYFSGDGGNTNLNYFNSNPSGDFGDWASSAGNNSYDAFSNSGVVNPVTQADITVMNILGYDLTSQTSSPVPTITAIVETPSAGDLNAGKTITITLDFSATVTVAGGTPTLTLNDGGNATYFNGSGSGTLSFTYTVAASDSNVSSLAVTAVNLNGATITDSAGNVQLSLTGLPQSGPQIDTTIPTPTSIVETPSNGIVNIGTVVVFTLGFNEAVTVSAGRRR